MKEDGVSREAENRGLHKMAEDTLDEVLNSIQLSLRQVLDSELSTANYPNTHLAQPSSRAIEHTMPQSVPDASEGSPDACKYIHISS